MSGLPLGRRTTLWLVAVAFAAATALALLPLPAYADTATLHVTSGTVALTRAGVMRDASGGGPLREGDEVATSADGSAVIAFADGSTLTVDPATRLSLAEISVYPASTVTRIFQASGRTWSSVQRLTSSRSRYEIQTPALTASVRGTAFEVDVAGDGTTRVHTVEGAVHVANAAGEALVVAGTQTTATPTTPPAPPATLAPAPLRTLRIGPAPIVLLDDAGRSCGRVQDAVLQQIPGCTVRDDEIRVEGPAAARPLRQREVSNAASAIGVVVVTPRPDPAPVSEVTIPIIGPLPVQLSVRTLAPATPPLPAATSLPSASPSLAVPTIPPLPTAAPTAAPTLMPALVPTTAPAAAPTVAPGVVPSVAPPIPSAVPSAEPVAVPTAPGVTAAPPTPVPAPVPLPTLAPCVPVPAVRSCPP